MVTENVFFRKINRIIEFLQSIGIEPASINHEYYLKTIKRLLEEEHGLKENYFEGLPKAFYNEVILNGIPLEEFCKTHSITHDTGIRLQESALKFILGRRTEEEYIEKERETSYALIRNSAYIEGYCNGYKLNHTFITKTMMPLLEKQGFNHPYIACALVRYYGEKVKNGKNIRKIIPNIENKDMDFLMIQYSYIHEAFNDGINIFTAPADKLFVPPKRLLKSGMGS